MRPLSVAILVVALVLQAVPSPAAGAPAGTGVVRGQLVDEDNGDVVVGEPVEIFWVPPESTREFPYPWTPMDGSRRPRPVAEVSTDAQGGFTFEALGPGQYWLLVRLPQPEEQVYVDVVDGVTTEAVLKVHLGRVATGSILRPDGRPAAGAEVFLAGVEDGQGGNAMFDAGIHMRVVRDDGTFVLPGLPEGRCWIEAWHDDLGFSAAARLDDEDHADLVLRDERDRLYALGRGKFGGIGIGVGRDSAGYHVASVREGGAASRAGLTAGDRIVAVDGLVTAWMPLGELLMRCRGPEGRPVVLTLGRGEQRLDVEIVREMYE